MGREMKFAWITGSAMISGAILFAMMPAPKPQAPPPRPEALPPAQEAVSYSAELDSLSRASQAPPPPAPDYAPTWISPGGGTEAPPTKQGRAAKSGGKVDSIDFAPAVTAQEEPKPAPQDAPNPDQPPRASGPAAVAPPPASSDPERPNPNPNNNTELREWLRKGK